MEQLDLIPWKTKTKVLSSIYETEGIKYAGSKREIIPTLLAIAKQLEVKTVFDGFSGTTRVSQAFAKAGFRVWANDIADWSYVFGQCYLKSKQPYAYYKNLIDHLNTLKGKEGWFTENYGGSGNYVYSDKDDGRKKIWQVHNTKKLDAIRDEIDHIADDPIDRAVLLTSLIIAMDKVDSTVGHQASYLREWAPRSFNTMRMEVPALIEKKNSRNRVTQKDIFSTLKKNEYDLFYFDPPYGSSNEKMPPSRIRYASYYHLWTTIVRNDKPNLVGVVNRREDVSDTVAASVFEEFRRSEKGRFLAVEAIEKLLKNSPAPYMILSYNNQGRATFDELMQVCHDCSDDCTLIERDHKSNVMKAMRWTNEWVSDKEVQTKEFLFILSQNGKLPKFK